MPTAVVLGLRDANSLAYGIGQALEKQGITVIYSYQEKNKPTVIPLMKQGFPLEITNPDSIAQFVANLRKTPVDYLVHSIAYAKKRHLQGSLLDVDLDSWQLAMHISTYSFLAILDALRPLLTTKASILTLTYKGSTEPTPSYHLMGACKAALESLVRYLAIELHPLRVNALSPPAMRTTSAQALAGFEELYENDPHISLETLGDAAVRLLQEPCTGQIRKL